MIRRMPFQRPLILSIGASIFKDRADLVAKNVALRHQLSCLIHRGLRPKLWPVDRAFQSMLSRIWDGWRESLAPVKPATVVAWHRKDFKLFWQWKSRERGPVRPRISAELRKLIIEMAEMNVGLLGMCLANIRYGVEIAGFSGTSRGRPSFGTPRIRRLKQENTPSC